MTATYFKTAWRNLLKRKLYSFLTITGLAIALACCLMIYLYNSYHRSFDSYHKNSEAIYQLGYELHLEKTEYEKSSSIGLFNALRERMPQIGASALMIDKQSFIVETTAGDKKRFKEDQSIGFCNSDWFNLFKYNWLRGSPALLDEPNTVALTEESAARYFGNTDPMGQTLMLGIYPLKVIGIIAGKPSNTDLKKEMYVSFSSFKQMNPAIEDDFYTGYANLSSINKAFVAVKDIRQKRVVEKALSDLTAEKYGKDFAKYFHFKLLPLNSLHFNTRYGAAIGESVPKSLSLISFLILGIAAINFVNMIVAQQSARTIEIGTRKVLGASSKQLFAQFMTESLLITLLALLSSLLMVAIALPWANGFLFPDQPVEIVSYAGTFLYLCKLCLVAGIGAGIYPAFILSRVNIYGALKNRAGNFSVGIVRKLLIVFQNVVAQGLIAGTIVIVLQVSYLRDTDIGFVRESVIMIPLEKITDSRKAAISEELNSLPGVKAYSFCFKSPSADNNRGATVKYNNRDDWEKWPARFAIGDSAYYRTFGIRIIAGRAPRMGQQRTEFLINEKMVNMLKESSPEAVIGKALMAGDTSGIIAGVVKDFSVNSMLGPIEPSVLFFDAKLQNNLAVKLSGANVQETLGAIAQASKKAFPDNIFTYRYMDEEIARLYKAEIMQQKLVLIGAVMAIIISCLGLLGLLSIITVQRTKEIGIRKVLGANVSSIIGLLSIGFVWLLVWSAFISFPLTWWLMNHWLNNFAYHIEIKGWIFILAGCLSLGLGFVTILFRSLKVAYAKAVDSIRYE